MRSSSLVVAVVVVLAGFLGCSHPSSPRPPSGSWRGPEMLANVPAETPYVIAWLQAPDDAVRARMSSKMDRAVAKALDAAAALPLDKRLALPPYHRALLGVLDAMRGTNPKLYLENLGFKHNGQWIVYGLGIWPVLRIEVSDAAKLRKVLADAIATLGAAEVQERQLAGTPYWVASKFGVTAIVSVTEHDLVAAVVPSTSLERATALVLGTAKVERNLRDTGEVTALIERHHFTSNLIAEIDSRRVVAALERKDDFATTSVFSAPACHADYERIAAAVPRFLFGYRQLDARGFAADFAVELAPAVAQQLASLHTAMPEPPDADHALTSLVLAADLDTGVGVVRGWLEGLAARPFECPQLAPTKNFVANALEHLQNAVPKELKGLRGVELVVTDARESPPGGSGFVVVAGEQIAVVLGQALQKVPGLGGLTIAPDGQPISLPVALLGLDWLKSAHLALHTSRVALAVGDRSKTDVTAALAAPNAKTTPLAYWTFDFARVLAQLPSMASDSKEDLSYFRTVTLEADVRDDTLAFAIGGTWLK